MLEMSDRNSTDGQRAGDLAHHREHYRALDFRVATGESYASDFTLAVNRLIADYQSFDGPEIELCLDLPGGELRPALQVPVLCIVRELLTNACRHSKSRRILVGIGRDDTHVYIQVQDWGVGFNCTALSPKRRGLKGVRELVQSLGGIVDIDSRLGDGTCIAIEIPVVKEPGQAGIAARDKD
jgi:signal transduction histidine kinase